MSLSATPKDTLTTAQMLVDIMAAVKSLSDIEQLSKDVYALPEREMKKAESSRADISKNETVLATINQRQAELDAAIDENNNILAEIEDGRKKQADADAALEHKKRTLEALAANLTEREAKLKSDSEVLLNGQNKLAQDERALETRRQEVNAYADTLKEKAEAVQNLTKGL